MSFQQQYRYTQPANTPGTPRQIAAAPGTPVHTPTHQQSFHSVQGAGSFSVRQASFSARQGSYNVHHTPPHPGGGSLQAVRSFNVAQGSLTPTGQFGSTAQFGSTPMRASFQESQLQGSQIQGSQIEGSQLQDSFVAANATQLAGLLTSISGGSLFLKQSFGEAGASIRNRTSLIPKHNTSSFVSRNYQIVKELGKGSFSRVQLLKDRRSGAPRVLKISEGGMGTKQSQMLKNEIHLLSALDHPSIVKLYEYSEDINRGQLLMVLEYVGGGDCQQLLRSFAKPQTEPFLAKLIWQLLSAVNYCHIRGILHCDIKPENMMLTCPRDGMPDCKLIDFGLCHRIDVPTRDFVGTPSYMAPEIVKGTVCYTVKADLWSAGVTACELLATKAPFGRPNDFKGKIDPVLKNIKAYRQWKDIEERLRPSDAWKGRSSLASDFVQSIIIADPADRPHADQALEHPWLVRNKQVPASLSSEMLRSMAKFKGASALMRRCLLIIAARLGSSKLERIGQVFLYVDANHQGRVSREELAGMMSRELAACWEPEIDVDDFFDAADQDQTGLIGFTEFAATCLWGADDNSDTIAARCFMALDDNHDGMVRMDEIRHLFREKDLLELRNLPTTRPFSINEWRACAAGSSAAHVDMKPSKPEFSTAKSTLGRIIRALMCSEDAPHAENNYEVLP